MGGGGTQRVMADNYVTQLEDENHGCWQTGGSRGRVGKTDRRSIGEQLCSGYAN